jgi:DNA-binding MarR family transcriptional regulator
MGLQQELNLPNPLNDLSHEAIMNIAYTGEILAKEAQRILRPLGLTDSQFNVLMILKYQSDNGQMNQTGIGDRLLVNRSNVTGLVDRMEQAGWLKRFAAPDDRRVNLVRITDDGEEILEKAFKVYYERIHEVMNSITQKDQNTICKLLERVRMAIREEK